MIQSNITVVSSYAIDRIYDKAGNWIDNQQGGPCLFIVDAMQRQKISYHVLSPIKKALVNIHVYDGQEFGTIKFVPNFDVDWSAIISPFIIISTVLDELSLDNIENYNGKTCLDVQGFVRKTRSVGRTIWNVPPALYSCCFCVKATQEELKYLPNQFIEQQKRKVLIVTRGSRGVEYWENGVHKEILPKEVVSCSNAIGAGDTFFANFVAELSKNESVHKAIENSVNETSNFLKRKHKSAKL